MSLSKGLGAPAGSMLAGSADLIERAHRYRRMAGGAMRQAGILAAAGSYALAHNVDRLAEDHANARLLAEELLRGDDIELDLAAVQTNIVIFRPGRPPRRSRMRRRSSSAAASVACCSTRSARGPCARSPTSTSDADQCRAAAKVMRAVADGATVSA